MSGIWRGKAAAQAATTIEVATFPSVRALPAEALALLTNGDSLFDSMAWWQVVEAHAMPADADCVYLTVKVSGRMVALVPLLRHRHRLGSLTTPYTCSFSPVVSHGTDPCDRHAAMMAFARFARPFATVRLDALPAEWIGLPALRAGCRQAGMIPLRFAHFGNWHEDVSDLDWAGYLRRRPGALRATIRRRLRQAEKMPQARFDVFTSPEQVSQAAEAFESVYRRSWKEPEPYPSFNASLMQAMAGLGLLRLGVWSIGPVPVAVQLWTVHAGSATVLKLAHDEAFRTHSPGTVLTALMLRHLLENDAVKQIDFGRGDDAYKQGWAMQRRQRIGLLLVDPWRPAGSRALLRHCLGRLRALCGPRHHGAESGPASDPFAEPTKTMRLELKAPVTPTAVSESATAS